MSWTERVRPRDWTERAWLALERGTTDSGRVWRTHATLQPRRNYHAHYSPLAVTTWLGERLARTRLPEPSTDEIVAATVKRRMSD